VDPAAEGCFFANALLLFDWGFLVAGWFVSSAAEGRGSIRGVKVVAGGCLAPDRDRRLAAVVVVVAMDWARASFILATGPRWKGKKSEGKRKGEKGRQRGEDSDLG